MFLIYLPFKFVIIVYVAYKLSNKQKKPTMAHDEFGLLIVSLLVIVLQTLYSLIIGIDTKTYNLIIIRIIVCNFCLYVIFL